MQERYGVAIDRKCSNLSHACFPPHDPGCYLHPARRTASPARPTVRPMLPTGREPFDPVA